MSVKKILSIIMALAIVLTMASFPAFAADAVPTTITPTNPPEGWDSPLMGKHSHKSAANSIDKATDGDYATHFTSDQYNGKNYNLIFELNTPGTLDTLKIEWGGTAWGHMPAEEYTVSVAGDDCVFTEILSYTGLYDPDAAAAAYPGKYEKISGSKGGGRMDVTITETGLNIANARYIKITVKKSTTNASIREISATVIPGGTTPEEPEGPVVPTPNFKEDSIETLGANIRLATEALSAGLRFGATVNKADAAIEGDYVYGDEANVKFGMYLLPAEMVDVAGGETLKDLVEAGNEDVLDVVAKKILEQDEETLTFTAVLVDIPEGAYNKNIIALPYAKVGDEVIYYDTDANSFTGVAQAAYDANEAGTVTLTEDQIKALKDILGIEEEPAAATYTVNYVDAEGNAIAVAKNGAGFVGDEVTETAVEVEGYTADKASETITLVDGVNTITFTYTKNEEPAPEEPAGDPVATAITVSNAAYPSPLWGKHTSNGATKSLDKAVDGDATTFFSSDQYNGKNYDLVFVLETAGTLDSLTINWGGAAWGEMAPEAYKVSVAGEDEVFTEILSYEGLYDTTAAAEAYAGYQHVSGSKGGGSIKINVTETGLNVANAKYLKITVVKSTNRASIYEIAATVIPN